MKLKTSIFMIAMGLAAGSAVAADMPITSEGMPSGITLQPLGRAQGYGPQRWRQVSRAEIVYANERGLTTYTSDDDKDGKSACVGECAQNWLPVVPVAKAKPVAGWTIVSHPSGMKQWAHNGKPLYTFKNDKEGGDVMGLGADPEADARHGIQGHEGKALKAQLPKGWRIHKSHTGGEATNGIATPVGFKIHEVGDANGVVIVDMHNPEVERTLYAYNGDLTKDNRACGTQSAVCAGFAPVESPILAKAVGEWTIVERKDGIRQWAFRSKPLYTYEADRITGDVHGVNVDKRWQLVVVDNYFMPKNVVWRDDFIQGRILATDKGMTLYRRNILSFNPASVQLAHDRPYRPRIGRHIRDVACDAVCQKAYKPYLAAKDAQPQGYFGIYVRADGTKQWTYKDFALYTAVDDKAPGDANGDGVYSLLMSDDPAVNNDVGYPGLYKSGFYWMVATF